MWTYSRHLPLIKTWCTLYSNAIYAIGIREHYLKSSSTSSCNYPLTKTRTFKIIWILQFNRTEINKTNNHEWVKNNEIESITIKQILLKIPWNQSICFLMNQKCLVWILLSFFFILLWLCHRLKTNNCHPKCGCRADRSWRRRWSLPNIRLWQR